VQRSDGPYRSVNVLFLPTPDERPDGSQHIDHLRPSAAGMEDGGRMSLLEVEDLTVTYGGSVLALEGVSLRVDEGSALALLGANGAGKTTLLRAVGGLLAYHSGVVRSGDIRFEGRSTIGLRPPVLVAAGIGQSLEGRRIFTELTVRENLRVGAFSLGARVPYDGTLSMVLELFPPLAQRLDHKGGVLSGGEQQMLAIARGLMARPRLLLLDEPSLGLAPRVVEHLAAAMRRIVSTGTSILLVDQSTTLALEVARDACLLETGRVRDAGPAAELLSSDLVRASYLGTAAGHDYLAAAAGEEGAP
jgi:branched-chain amino acid transport system ATP-binding protein